MKIQKILVTIISLCLGFGSAVFGQSATPPKVTTPVLTPTAPTPSTTPVTTVASNQLPPQIAAMSSEIELFSYALSNAQWVDVFMSSQGQVGESYIPPMRLNGPATLSSIQQALRDMAASIKMVTGSTEYVSYTVRVRDVNGTLSVSGNDYKKPVPAKAASTIPFVVDMSLEYSSLILWKNLRGLKMTTFDDQGRVAGTFGINYDAQGFYFPTHAAGKVLLEVTVQDGDKTVTTVYDLRKAAPAVVDTVTTSTTVTLRNYVEVIDKDQIILVPETYGGVGDNVLGAIILTKAMTVSVASRTIENKNATGFKYRQIDSSTDTGWKTVVANANGMVTLQLGIGKWHVFGTYPEGSLKAPIFVGDNGKG